MLRRTIRKGFLGVRVQQVHLTAETNSGQVFHYEVFKCFERIMLTKIGGHEDIISCYRLGAAGNSHADRHCLRAGSTHSALLLLLGPITCCSVYMGCTHVGALAERGTVVCDPNVMVQTHLGVGIVIPHHQHREGRCNFFLHRPRGTYAEENVFAICPAMRWPHVVAQSENSCKACPAVAPVAPSPPGGGGSGHTVRRTRTLLLPGRLHVSWSSRICSFLWPTLIFSLCQLSRSKFVYVLPFLSPPSPFLEILMAVR